MAGGYQGWSPDSPHPWAAHFRTKVTIPTTTTHFDIINGFGTLMALVMEETTGMAGARFELWDGETTGGEYVGPWTLFEGQSFDNAYPPKGLIFRNGLYIDVTSGSVAGVAYIGTLVPWPQVYGSGE
jgi:hypothetical protein